MFIAIFYFKNILSLFQLENSFSDGPYGALNRNFGTDSLAKLSS